MQDPQPLDRQTMDPRDAALMEALGGLALPPTETSLRDIWYRAGVDAGRRRANRWRAIAAVVTLSAGALLAWDWRPNSPGAERIVYVRQEERRVPSTDPKAELASLAYVRTRDAILQNGLDALPAAELSGDGGQTFTEERPRGLNIENAPGAVESYP